MYILFGCMLSLEYNWANILECILGFKPNKSILSVYKTTFIFELLLNVYYG